MEPLIILALLSGAAGVSGLPQKIYKNKKDFFSNAVHWGATKWYNFNKLLGNENPEKGLELEKNKIEKNLKNINIAISTYESINEDLHHHIETMNDDVTSILKEKEKDIQNKIEKANVQKGHIESQLSAINRDIKEVYSDKLVFNIENISDENTDLLKHKANVRNIKNKKNHIGS